MNRVILRKLKITNFGPIKNDEVIFEPFTYFVGRNNSGKSHYLKAIEILLATKSPSAAEIIKLQNDKSKEIIIEGEFEGVENFTSLVTASNHKKAIDEAIKDGILRVVRVLDPGNEDKTTFGVYKDDGTIHNPGGFSSNLLKVLPDPISISATADTIDELKNTQNTALSKLKKEALTTFFEELKTKTQKTLINLDIFLHSKNCEQRSQELIKFETHLKEELMGEFAEVMPSVEFNLPDEEVIAKEMKIFLDDGYRSEIEQKGHGLQRATLLALLKVLAKYGARYQDKPSPIFLVGELESFLHPFAQKQFAEVLLKLVDQYQIVTTTHSPFIITPQAIDGYRRIQKKGDSTKSIMILKDSIDTVLLKRHLERRGNLEGLFADRIILIEGSHDENFYDKLREIFNISLPEKKFTLFIKAGGKEELRQSRKFYKQMNFDDVSVICDLDYLFSNDFKNLLKELGLDENLSTTLRQHIEWTNTGDPPLKYVIEKIQEKGEPTDFENTLNELSKNRIFSLRKGAPENYYKNNNGIKGGWSDVNSENDLLEVDYLKKLIESVLGGI
jgi:predicted ATP-dependent endonuclease of OLD family